MIPMSLAQVCAAVDGTLHLDPEARLDASVEHHRAHPEQLAGQLIIDGPVQTDSRACEPGSLYVARIGEHADGHDFVGSASAQGAVAALVSRPVPELPCIVVDDVQLAFGRLARAVLDLAEDLTVVAITGSSGKTSTKDLLAQVLAGENPSDVVAPENSLNGEIGVPLTVCRIQPDTRYLVAEMGARGVGHIAYLTNIAPPRISVVLNVGTAHLGEFGSVENIAVAKGEIVEALPADGLAVLNADDPVVSAMAARTNARVQRVGMAEDADLRATDVALDATGRASFTVHTPDGRSAPVNLRLRGAHHVGNALSVIAVALELGLDLTGIAARLGTVEAISRWRMQVTERPDGVTVINDAYNANPDSMRAALVALSAMSGGRRSWAVLGSMLELGESSEADHRRVGELAVELGVHRLLVVGEAAAAIADGANGAAQVRTVADADAAAAVLDAELAAGDIVLFKSSRDAGLRHLGDRVAEAGAR